MNAYGIRNDYQARLYPAYFQDVRSDGKVWQPDVVPIATYLARRLNGSQLIDIGCGRGQNLVPYANEFAIIGVDYGDNIDYCQQYPFGQWMACDLENQTPNIKPEVLRQSVVICSDVIEHLVYPDHLAQTLAYFAEHALAVVLTTPDRERTYGYNQQGPPGNPHHIREWTLDEMGKWLQTFTPQMAWAGWTVSNNVDRVKNTLMIILNRTRQDKLIAEIESLFNVEAWHGDR